MSKHTVYWDENTIMASEEGHCFFCGAPTYLVDINYEDYYCGKDEEAIGEDLRRLDEQED